MECRLHGTDAYTEKPHYANETKPAPQQQNTQLLVQWDLGVPKLFFSVPACSSIPVLGMSCPLANCFCYCCNCVCLSVQVFVEGGGHKNLEPLCRCPPNQDISRYHILQNRSPSDPLFHGSEASESSPSLRVSPLNTG